MATEEALRALAAQLRKPQGTSGTDIGNLMQETNAGMIQDAIRHLELHPGDQVLELGQGNGQHVASLFEQCPGIRYTGLEISPLMMQESLIHNQPLIRSGRAEFALYDGTRLPLPQAHFDKIFTVNTIYFWDAPVQMLEALADTSKATAHLIITYMEQSYLSQVPFSKYGFQLYHVQQIEQIAHKTAWKIAETRTNTEIIRGPKGHPIPRIYTTVILKKGR